MQRLDSQDSGPAYRNVIGLPGGVNSPLFAILKASCVFHMPLCPLYVLFVYLPEHVLQSILDLDNRKNYLVIGQK